MAVRKEEVAHEGRVVAMTPQMTTVQIVSRAACSECHAAGLCGMSELAEKTIQVPTDPYATYAVGDTVNVVLAAEMGLKAVLLAYFLPLVVLLAAILGLTSLGVAEVPAGLAGIGLTGVYYFVLWLLRGHLGGEFVFRIKSY